MSSVWGRARRGAVNVKILAAGLLLVVPLVVVLANGFRYDPHEIKSPLIQKAAPDFTLATVQEGQELSLSGFRGKPVVVNFWATWCVPCKAEHATLLQLAKRYDGRVQFLGVVYQDKPEAIAEWLQKRGSAFPQLVDVGSKAALAYGVYGVPETFLIDGKGTIVDKITGPVDGQDMLLRLDALLAGG